jgi:hypothetical protein
MIPSTLLFGDPRLSEYVGTAFLHGATLLGLFLLGRKFFGVWCGCLAVVLYGLSAPGLFQAGSLWPIGRPDFFVWTVYLASEWVTRRDARYLAAAGAVWGVGMYVDMAIAPLFFLLPVLWLIYRPSIRLKSLLVSGAVVLVVWYPYLRFEATRDFADIRSQLLLDPIFPADLRRTWCDPTLPLRVEANSPARSARRVSAARAGTAVAHRSLFRRSKDEVDERLLANFPTTRIPGARIVLLLMVLVALLVFATPPPRAEAPPGGRRPRWKRWVVPLALAVVLCGLVARVLVAPFVDVQSWLPFFAVSPFRTFAKLVVAFAIALLLVTWGREIVQRLLARARVPLAPHDSPGRTQLAVLCLAVPWFLLVVVSEPGRPERFLWLWPLQVLFLAAFATNLLMRLRVPLVAVWIVGALLVFSLVDNPLLESRVRAWNEDGWSGRDAPEVQVVDYVAAQLDAEGKDEAPIGYHVFVYPFMAEYNVISSQYKVGADFDLLFKYRRRITNTDTCAEGFSPEDEYRVVRTRPEKEVGAPRHYFDIPPETRFRLRREFGPYQVFKRV